MKKIQTEVLVLGGGATGAGVARDLAMRGFKTILVEQGDLTNGTTGRYHGLLHSGGRYVVKDPQAARECIQENHILRHIMPHCIEDTGGFFVITPWDDPGYALEFIQGCQNAGIPVEEISIRQMLKEEPSLNPNIQRCFRVPDGAADSFLATDANAGSARQYGAQILTYHKAMKLLSDRGPGEQPTTVTGAVCHDLVKDEDVEILSDMVVNALGAWSGQVAGTIGIPIQVVPGKGTMVAFNHRFLNTVINRCKMPSDGDIIVPIHTVAVAGTTDIPVPDPDHFAIEPWEVELILSEGEKLVPGLREMRILRAWAGVRPLYKETRVENTRQVTRAYVLLDHETRDGIAGLVTITSGKWTTYRKMAEVTVDLVCQKLGVSRECRTHMEPLPNSSRGYHRLGARLVKIEQETAYGDLVCECELATYQDVKKAILDNGAQTIDDIRRDVRLGMGPCQGGFCAYRIAGILQALRNPPVAETNVALRDFLQERWKGLLPVLWGQQLKQERLDELIYLSVLNAQALPGPQASHLGSENYAQPAITGDIGKKLDDDKVQDSAPDSLSPAPASIPGSANLIDVLVIGAGLAGLTAGWQAAVRGKRVRVISRGYGALYWDSGCIDVLGYYPIGSPNPLDSPVQGLEQLFASQPHHPYALLGLDRLAQALLAVQRLCEDSGYPMLGKLERNWLLPTALGTLRPTCLAPESMVAGDVREAKGGQMLIAGFQQFGDFYPRWISANLQFQSIQAEDTILDLPSLRDRNFVTGRTLARHFEDPEFRAEVIAALRHHLGKASRVGFPAVLGISNGIEVKRELEKSLGIPVFEIPTLPPSLPGMRLHQVLVKAIEQAGGKVYDGMRVVSAQFQGNHINSISSEAAARLKNHRAREYILATGGLLGGGTLAEYSGDIREIIFNLPVRAPGDRSDGLEREFLSPRGHPVFQSGIPANHELRPVDENGNVIFENLSIAGSALDAFEAIRERSLEGVALVTGYTAGGR